MSRGDRKRPGYGRHIVVPCPKRASGYHRWEDDVDHVAVCVWCGARWYGVTKA